MGSKNPKDTSAARRARVEEMRRAEQARDRRSKIIKLLVSLVVLAVIVGAGWYLVASTRGSEKAKAALIAGEKTWSDLSRNHVTEDVAYPMAPPRAATTIRSGRTATATSTTSR